MTTIEVQSQLPFDTLLKSLPQLSSEELAQLAQHSTRLQAQRKAPSLPEAEAALLLKINQGVVPLQVRERCATLSEKARSGELTAAEQQELAQLVDEIEQLNAERLGYLAELARLRQISLPALMKALEITPLSYE